MSRFYIREQWRAATYDGEIVHCDGADEAAENCTGEPEPVWSVFAGDNGEDDAVVADCYTPAEAEHVRGALEYFHEHHDEHGQMKVQR